MPWAAAMGELVLTTLCVRVRAGRGAYAMVLAILYCVPLRAGWLMLGGRWPHGGQAGFGRCFLLAHCFAASPFAALSACQVGLVSLLGIRAWGLHVCACVYRSRRQKVYVRDCPSDGAGGSGD